MQNIAEKVYQVSIYTYTNIKGPRRRDAVGVYILETETAKGPATRTEFIELPDTTEHKANLTILLKALKRLNGKCILTIYTESKFIEAGFKQETLPNGSRTEARIANWRRNGWKNSKGKPIANMEEWQEIAEILNGNAFSFGEIQNNTYRNWMIREVEKRANEHHK